MKKMSKKCSTDQRFIRKRNTTYKIGTLHSIGGIFDPPSCNFLVNLFGWKINLGLDDYITVTRMVLCSLPNEILIRFARWDQNGHFSGHFSWTCDTSNAKLFQKVTFFIIIFTSLIPEVNINISSVVEFQRW